MGLLRRARALAVTALIATFGWKLLRRRQNRPLAPHRGSLPGGYEGEQTVARPLASDVVGAAADTARATRSALRMAFVQGRRAVRTAAAQARERRSPQAAPRPHAEGDGGRVQFEWVVRTSDPQQIRAALATAGVDADAVEAGGPDRPEQLIDRLRQTGIPLDQELGSGFVVEPSARYVGSVSAGRLVDAIEHALRVARTGLIVDAADPRVAIDEHQDVGKGVVALVSARDSRLVRADLERSLLQAFATTPARVG